MRSPKLAQNITGSNLPKSFQNGTDDQQNTPRTLPACMTSRRTDVGHVGCCPVASDIVGEPGHDDTSTSTLLRPAYGNILPRPPAFVLSLTTLCK